MVHLIMSRRTGAGALLLLAFFLIGDPACDDQDADGILDSQDNCMQDPNPDQADQDSDGIGDVCDTCPAFADPSQTDSDSDGVGDLCDNCPQVPNALQEDEDLDGTGDACEAKVLPILNPVRSPTRLAMDSAGNIYHTDPVVGSIFIYDASLKLVGELSGLDRPLGIVVDPGGNIYVGNDGRDNVEVYSQAGVKLKVIDGGNIRMPNDLVLDARGNLYVVDSLESTIRIYDATGTLLRNIGHPGEGDGGLRFPVAVLVDERDVEKGEVLVADQGNALVQVFDLEGAFLRSFGGPVPAFSEDWQGKFVKLQGISMDSQGRLHALDCFMNRIQILDAEQGTYVDAYGEFGTEAGKLNLPLDLLISSGGAVIVANSGNRRIEAIYSVQ